MEIAIWTQDKYSNLHQSEIIYINKTHFWSKFWHSWSSGKLAILKIIFKKLESYHFYFVGCQDYLSCVVLIKSCWYNVQWLLTNQFSSSCFSGLTAIDQVCVFITWIDVLISTFIFFFSFNMILIINLEQSGMRSWFLSVCFHFWRLR